MHPVCNDTVNIQMENGDILELAPVHENQKYIHITANTPVWFPEFFVEINLQFDKPLNKFNAEVDKKIRALDKSLDKEFNVIACSFEGFNRELYHNPYKIVSVTSDNSQFFRILPVFVYIMH